MVAGSGYGGQSSFDGTSNRVTSPSFAYDTSGNLTANGPASSFSYDQGNFMATAGTTAYTYDVQDRRVRKNVSGVVTDYFYAGSEVIAEKQGSTWTDYIFFGDQRIVQQNGSMASTAIYLHPDHLGSTRVCTDSNGVSNGACDYEPFGEVQPSGCSVPTIFRFGGAQWDSESGLYHFWFRQYDPTQGRWMSVDPLPGTATNPQSLDRYAYALNDPVNLVDASGLSVELRNGRTSNCSLDGVNVGCDFLIDYLGPGWWVCSTFSTLWSKRSRRLASIGDQTVLTRTQIAAGAGTTSTETGVCSSSSNCPDRHNRSGKRRPVVHVRRFAGKGGTIPVASPSGELRLGFNAKGSVGASVNLGKYLSGGVSGQVAPFYSCKSGSGGSAGSE